MRNQKFEKRRAKIEKRVELIMKMPFSPWGKGHPRRRFPAARGRGEGILVRYFMAAKSRQKLVETSYRKTRAGVILSAAKNLAPAPLQWHCEILRCAQNDGLQVFSRHRPSLT